MHLNIGKPEHLEKSKTQEKKNFLIISISLGFSNASQFLRQSRMLIHRRQTRRHTLFSLFRHVFLQMFNRINCINQDTTSFKMV